jgi:hypothetical protein
LVTYSAAGANRQSPGPGALREPAEAGGAEAADAAFGQRSIAQSH